MELIPIPLPDEADSCRPWAEQDWDSYPDSGNGPLHGYAEQLRLHGYAEQLRTHKGMRGHWVNPTFLTKLLHLLRSGLAGRDAAIKELRGFMMAYGDGGHADAERAIDWLQSVAIR